MFAGHNARVRELNHDNRLLSSTCISVRKLLLPLLLSPILVLVVVWSGEHGTIPAASTYGLTLAEIPPRVDVQALSDGVKVLRTCSGAALDAKTVVTSAHCVAGATHTSIIDGALRREVKSVEIHKKWTLGDPRYDVALLRLGETLLQPVERVSFPGRPLDKGAYTLAAWSFGTATGCSMSLPPLADGGHMHMRCLLSKGASGSGLFLDTAQGRELVGVLSQLSDGVASLTPASSVADLYEAPHSG